MAGKRWSKRLKRDVLFICVHNGARSQMAEAFFNELCPDGFIAESAGLEPGTLNPLAVAAMSEIGIDISAKYTRSVRNVAAAGRCFAYVITVCDEASAERCPIFPGHALRLHWSFADPAALHGTWDRRLAQTRVIRDDIRAKIAAWCAELS
jgi:arsenate reductase